MIRKIASKQDESKRKKRNQLIVGGVLILVMLLSTFGYSLYSRENETDNSNEIIYNGFEFVKQDELWFLNLNSIDFIFKYNPNEVPKVYGILKYANEYSGEPVYIFSENIEAEQEVYNNLRYFAQRIQRACFQEDICNDETLPIKTCNDNFIIIRNSNYTNIIQEDNCVFIQSPEENLTQVTDEFLFKILGVEE